MAEPSPVRPGSSDTGAERVTELQHAFGSFERSERVLPQDPRGRVPVLRQRLDARRYAVAFTRGSRTHEVLANDQNRFAPPRSLPPILDFAHPDDADDGSPGTFEIVRYAWSPGAFRLLDDLLADGHALDTFEFVALTWQLGQALGFLHENGVLQGQWNAKSVVALPDRTGLDCPSAYRFELLNTGVGFTSPDAVPEDYVARGYYPPEVFVQRADVPDLSALDAAGDVYCFAAFLKDLLQRSCSTEELPTRATRLMNELHERAVRRGWRANPETLRRKELEILDHLYTARARTEYLIQEGLRPRDERADAATIVAKAGALHRTIVAYLRHLEECGFEPHDAFANGDEGLLHYTTFAAELTPARIHGLEDSELEIRGRDLPDELVRVTLNEHSDGIHVLSASPSRIVIRIDAGLPSGTYSVSINNRRTTAQLEVAATQWADVEPATTHVPWAGCDPIELRVRGLTLPRDVAWALCPEREAERDRGPIGVVDEDRDEMVPLAIVDASTDASDPLETVRLRVPIETRPGAYQLRANFLPTPLRVVLDAALPDPLVHADEPTPATIRNHRDWTIELRGEHLHENMLVHLEPETPAGFACSVVDADRAELTIPAGFPAGRYTLHVNRTPTPVELVVEAPTWAARGQTVTARFGRGQDTPSAVVLAGSALPDPAVGDDGYALVDARGRPIADALAGAEREPIGDGDETPRDDPDTHRLFVSATARRGRRELTFAGRPTGVAIAVRKPTPRVVQATALAVLATALTLGGLAVRARLEPRLDSLEPTRVFALRPDPVVVTGANVAAVELWRVEDVAPGTHAIRAGATPAATIEATHVKPDAYRITLPDVVAAGRYRLRPLGPVAADVAAGLELVVASPAITLQPRVANRLRDTVLELGAADGFALDRFTQAELVGTEATRRVDVRDGRFAIRAGELNAPDEGRYRLAFAGLPLDDALEIEVVGPTLTTPPPSVVTLGRGGRAVLALEVEHAGDEPWLGLIPATAGPSDDPVRLAPGGAEAEAEVAQRAETTATVYHARVGPGSYRVVAGLGPDDAEPVSAPFQVLPRPAVLTVDPPRVAPGQPTRVVVRGVHLTGSEALVVRPLTGAADPETLPSPSIDPALVVALADDAVPATAAGFGQELAVTLTLPSGKFAIGAAGHLDAGVAELSVYDDCSSLLTAYRAGAVGPNPLLECLARERPSATVVRETADLLFDRGRFTAAAELYATHDDAPARFRAAFIARFVDGRPVQALTLDALADRPDYAAAAAAMGWTLGRSAVDWPPDLSAWETVFVRGVWSDDPNVVLAQMDRVVQLRAAAAAPVDPEPFAPIDKVRAEAVANAAIALVAIDAAVAGRSLRAEVVDRDDVWKHVSSDTQAEALFWSAHAAHWYDGDDALALEHLNRASRGTGRAASWSSAYLRALGAEPTLDEPIAVDASNDASWPARFVAVLADAREVHAGPNYDLLAGGARRDATLDPRTRERAAALSRRLEALEAVESPGDPFAHFALLHGLRVAQQVTWPQEHDGAIASRHRQRLLGLPLDDALEPLRAFYLATADLEPLTLAQVVVLPKETLRARLDELRALAEQPLPETVRDRATELTRRLSLPSVEWSRNRNQSNQ